ncbi:MAG: ABC transporter ATP-binding protein [Dehalococcoidia bacterium]|jgi:branched-chain amino acid transport system ATP-binding protein
MAYLEIKGLTKYFSGLVAVRDFSFEVHKGEAVGLIGPNGSGKTTVLNMIGGYLRPNRGNIVFDGKDIVGLPPHLISARGIGRMFQIGGIFPELSVLENISIGGHLRLKTSFWGLHFSTLNAKRGGVEHERLVREVLGLLGLGDVMEKRAGDLPKGLQRFLSLGMLLSRNPALCILDEPATGMNAEEMATFFNIVNKFKEENGTTLVIVDHDMKVIMENCSRIIVIHYGEKIAEDSPDGIIKNPDVNRVYLGEGDYIA